MHRRLACFDFDQTISVIHVFACLTTGKLSPKAVTERGHVKALLQLDASGWDIIESPSGPVLRAGTSTFSVAALGGPNRVALLAELLQDLEDGGVDVVVITKGYVGAVRTCLETANLLRHFRHVYGSVETRFAPWEDTPFDQDAPPSAHEGSEADTFESKAALVMQLAQERGLTPDEVLFVDDDRKVVRSVEESGAAVTICVGERQGLTSAEMERVREWIG